MTDKSNERDKSEHGKPEHPPHPVHPPHPPHPGPKPKPDKGRTYG